MSFQTLRHTLANEILTWVVFLILTGILIAAGVNIHSTPVAWVLAGVWFILLVVVYRIKYKRL